MVIFDLRYGLVFGIPDFDFVWLVTSGFRL